jgi:hypothetical protein
MEDIEEINGMSTQPETRNLIDVVTSIEVLEALSSKPYIVAKKMHSNKLAVERVYERKEEREV